MKTLLTLCIIFMLAVLGIAVFLPIGVSTPAGLRTAVQIANTQLPGELEIDSWQLSWLGTQRAQEIRYRDDELGLDIHFSAVSIDNSLVSLMGGFRDRIQLSVDGEINLATEADPITLSDLHAELGVPMDGRGVKGEISGQTRYQGKGGSVLVQGEVLHQTVDLDARFDNFPVPLLSALAKREELDALFGASLDAHLEAHTEKMNGSVSLEVISENSRWDFNGALLDGILSLNEDFRAELEVTPKLSRRVLRHINPLLLTAISAPEPIRMRIAAEGFEVPIWPFDLKNARMARGVIDFGRVTVENGGPVALVVSLFQAPELSRSDTMLTWFTPQYLHLEDGILHCERMDTLIHSSFHIATWGKVDLLRDQVDMVLGISGETLSKRFGIDGLPQGYMMQTPLQGRSDKIKMDVGKTIARIAGLRARSSSREESRILGSVLQVVTGTRLDDRPAPKPTTQPFPWER